MSDRLRGAARAEAERRWGTTGLDEGARVAFVAGVLWHQARGGDFTDAEQIAALDGVTSTEWGVQYEHWSDGHTVTAYGVDRSDADGILLEWAWQPRENPRLVSRQVTEWRAAE